MQLLSREVLRPHVNGRPVVNGFVSYIHPTDPTLMLCTGYEDYSDAYDDFSTCVSTDNGHTWSAPVPWLRGQNVAGGRLRYAEPGAFYDPDLHRLIVLVDENFHPNDTLDVDHPTRILLNTYDPAAGAWSGFQPLDLAPGRSTPVRSLAVSFPFPIKTARGRILFPAYRPVLGDDGQPVHYPGCWSPVYEALTIIGEITPDGGLRWHVGQSRPIDMEQSSRGLSENTIAELRDGRLAMIARGDNSMYPERPGYKWLSFSGDEGETWSEPQPLPCDTGDPLESSATGSALFRSWKTSKLYWMGNLCAQGDLPTGRTRARGNYPRVPLVVAEVQEQPFALKRDTITVIGDRAPGEPEKVQMSNFRFYQDRLTGELVVFVTRYAERSEQDWLLADYYRYRVELD